MSLTGLLPVMLAAISLFSACAPAAGDVTTVPTPTLLRAVLTDTPIPAPPTATSPVLPGPADIPTSQPDNPAVVIPAAAQRLISRTLDDLTQELGISRDTVQLHLVEAADWATVDLGCGEIAIPGSTDVTIPGYRIVFLVENTPYEYHTDTDSTFRRCEQAGTVLGETQSLLDIDPVASELVLLAQRRLGTALDLPTLRIDVTDVEPFTWSDTSLGCPQPGETYTPLVVDGYRIVLTARDQDYIFHTDFDRVIPCAPDNERLPDNQ
ncbi:MAG: hypothetical protein H6672_03170 [Anaerolineaceae bacterium]|nr:hypothetical protein [Anaerolineaceae bacterium]